MCNAASWNSPRLISPDDKCSITEATVSGGTLIYSSKIIVLNTEFCYRRECQYQHLSHSYDEATDACMWVVCHGFGEISCVSYSTLNQNPVNQTSRLLASRNNGFKVTIHAF